VVAADAATITGSINRPFSLSAEYRADMGADIALSALSQTPKGELVRQWPRWVIDPLHYRIGSVFIVKSPHPL
jgi:hypothetical protein